MIYVFGDYALDTCLYELRHGGESCSLGPQVFNVLAYLIAHRDRVVTKEALPRLRQALLDLVQQEVQPYHGALQAVGNDSFLVLFGVPVALEDHARRAVLAGLALQRRLHQPYKDPGTQDDIAFEVCLGVHTASVMVGSNASELQQPLTVVGAAHRTPPAVEEAEHHYRQALALAEALGMRPLMAHCHCGLGMLYLKTKRREQARTALSTAITLYRVMEMTFWLPQAEAALALVKFSEGAP